MSIEECVLKANEKAVDGLCNVAATIALTAYGSHYSPRDSPANESISKRYIQRAGEFKTRASQADELLKLFTKIASKVPTGQAGGITC